MAGFLYKPIAQGAIGGGRGVFLIGNTDFRSGGWYDSAGNLVERFDRFQGPPEPGMEPGVKFTTAHPGGYYGTDLEARFTDNNNQVFTYKIPNGAQRYQGVWNDPTSLKAVDKPGSGGVGGSVIPGTNVINPALADPNMINFNPVTFNPITAAPYTFTDPIEAAKRYAAFNTGQEEQAFQTGLSRAGTLSNLDQNAELSRLDVMSAKQQSLVAAENAFNQTQRLAAVDRGVPQARNVLNEELGRARTLASGRLLSDAEDRAYELAARSASGDQSLARGFGDDSIFGKRTSDILSAEQRLGLTQLGTSMLGNWLSQASGLLIDTPLKANLSQQIRAQPTFLPSQFAAQQQGALTNLTTLPNQFGISSEINQNQFSTNLEQGTRTFNASNDLASQEFNSSGQFQESVTKFNATVGNYDRVNAANQAAQDQIRQEAHDEAASTAANKNIGAQQNAQNASGVTQIVGAAADLISGAAGLINSAGTTEKPVTPNPGQSGGQQLNNGFGASTPILGSDGTATIPPNTPIPPGFTGVGSSADGGTMVAPSEMFGGQSGGSPDVQTFSNRIQPRSAVTAGGASATQPDLSYQQVASGIAQTGGIMTSLAGLGAGSPALGTFGSAISTGANLAQTLVGQGATSATTDGKLAIANHLQSQALANAHTTDEKNNVNDIYSKVKDSISNGVSVTGDALGISSFINNFDKLNNINKVRGLVNAGFQGTDMLNRMGITDTSAKSISQIKVPGTNGDLTLGNAIGLFNSGYNVYSLVNHWDEMSGIQKAIGGTNTVLSIANTARQSGLLGTATPASQAALQSTLTSVGAKSAGAYGAGAVSVPAASAETMANAGYTVTSSLSDGTVIAVPNTTLASTGASSGVLGSGTEASTAVTPGTLSTVAGAVAIGYGVYTIAQGWGQGGAAGRSNAAAGGLSIAAGMYALGYACPYAAAAIVVGSLVLGSIQAGKSGNQTARDQLRAGAEHLGLTDDKFNITLANGSKFDIGIDGHGGQREVYNTAGLRPDQKDIHTLNAWDLDYTKDLDAITGVAGNGLALMLYGDGHNDHVTQMGNYFTNAAVSTAKTADLTEAGFAETQKNMQKMYSDSGIKNKADAYALSNQLFAEGRVNQTQLVSIQQGINLTFDPFKTSFGAAHQLLEGVKLGRQGTDNKAPPAENVRIPLPPAKYKPAPKPPPGSEVPAGIVLGGDNGSKFKPGEIVPL